MFKKQLLTWMQFSYQNEHNIVGFKKKVLYFTSCAYNKWVTKINLDIAALNYIFLIKLIFNLQKGLNG